MADVRDLESLAPGNRAGLAALGYYCRGQYPITRGENSFYSSLLPDGKRGISTQPTWPDQFYYHCSMLKLLLCCSMCSCYWLSPRLNQIAFLDILTRVLRPQVPRSNLWSSLDFTLKNTLQRAPLPKPLPKVELLSLVLLSSMCWE